MNGSPCARLLTHTSGLAPEGSDGVGPSAYDEAFRQLVLANLDKTFTTDEILAYVRDRPLDFEPGTGVQYSNVNTILLGRIIEIVTGTPLTSVLHQRLLNPLGLAHTYFEAVEDGPRPHTGLFTLTDRGTILNTADFSTRGVLSSIGAAGAIVSNVDDLVLWSEHFLRAGAFGHTDLHDSRFAVDPQWARPRRHRLGPWCRRMCLPAWLSGRHLPARCHPEQHARHQQRRRLSQMGPHRSTRWPTPRSSTPMSVGRWSTAWSRP